MRDLSRRVSNNVRLIDLYARGKDFYKLNAMIGPLAGFLVRDLNWAIFGRRTKEETDSISFSKVSDELLEKAHKKTIQMDRLVEKERGLEKNTFHSLNPNNEDHLTSKDRKNAEIQKLSDEIQGLEKKSGFSLYEYYRAKREGLPKVKYRNLNQALVGDTLNFALQSGISLYSSSTERDMVLRTYKDIAKAELGINDRDIKFRDLKRVKNPIVKEAVDYYTKKSIRRALPDFVGLIRWIPKILFHFNKDLRGMGGVDGDSKLTKTLWFVAEKIDGIAALLGSKTFYFVWYFTNRQTGSFYQVEKLWNKTEGITNDSNREVNQNVLTGDFVNRLEIARLYEEFRKENPSLRMGQFTVNDPLTNRVFEQTSRYLNHSYQSKLFTISEGDKGLEDMGPGNEKKFFNHAMLVEFIGSGGLRAEDALGSAIRLEVLAVHGRKGVKEGIRKYREVSQILEKIKHPERATALTQEQSILEMQQYFKQLDSVGREYLGKYWPAKYINADMKEAFIHSIFDGLEISDKKIASIAANIYPREDTIKPIDRPEKHSDVGAMIDSEAENAKEAKEEAEYRQQQGEKTSEMDNKPEKKSSLYVSHKREKFSDEVERKRPSDIIEHPASEKSNEISIRA